MSRNSVEIICKKNNLDIKLPLTTPTGKARVKSRKSPTDIGTLVSTRQTPFSSDMYIEWQISYAQEAKEDNTNMPTFIAANGKRKTPDELGKITWCMLRQNWISPEAICSIIHHLRKIPDTELIDKKLQIKRVMLDNPINIADIQFQQGQILYPYLLHDLDMEKELLIEILIREQQKATKVQPMLFLCIPIDLLKDANQNSLIGRKAKTNEKAIFTLSPPDTPLILKLWKIFGLLSKGHKHDVISILTLILRCRGE